MLADVNILLADTDGIHYRNYIDVISRTRWVK
jgi:hypothetical protein